MNIAQKIQATAEMGGRPMSDLAIAAMAQHLQNEPDIEVSQALDSIARGGARLTLAAVLERLPGAPLGAEEAWALSERSLDEEPTVVLTEAMHEAVGEVRSLGSDRIAQRMAFKDAYSRISEEHEWERQRRKRAGDPSPLTWRPSLGTDRSHRVTAIREAYAKGRLTRIIAQRYLPPEESIDGALPAPPGYDAPRLTVGDEPVSLGRQALASLKALVRGQS